MTHGIDAQDILTGKTTKLKPEDFVTTRVFDDSPFIYTLPHAGTIVPSELIEPWNIDRRALEDTDLFTDDLYDFQKGTRLYTPLNRYAVNMNRVRRTDGSVETYEDEDALRTFLKGMTPAWETPIPDTWKETLLGAYDEYHNTLQQRVDNLKQSHGDVFLLACHSMNSEADNNTPDEGERPDITICTENGQSAPRSVIDSFAEPLHESAFSVRYNDPYQGGYTTRRYADNSSVHVIQVEVNKACYMDEDDMCADEKPLIKQVLYEAARRLIRRV